MIVAHKLWFTSINSITGDLVVNVNSPAHPHWMLNQQLWRQSSAILVLISPPHLTLKHAKVGEPLPRWILPTTIQTLSTPIVKYKQADNYFWKPSFYLNSFPTMAPSLLFPNLLLARSIYGCCPHFFTLWGFCVLVLLRTPTTSYLPL